MPWVAHERDGWIMLVMSYQQLRFEYGKGRA